MIMTMFREFSFSKLGVLLALFSLSAMMSCKKDKDDDNELPPQEIVTYDTSGITGQLTVKTFYLDNNNNQVPAYSTVVCLYANYDDIQVDKTNSTNDLAIYRLITESNDNEAYFGYINYGNYYVWASATINGVYYERISIVQVRPNREEVLNLTMLPSSQ
jgi:hypothetical protein